MKFSVSIPLCSVLLLTACVNQETFVKQNIRYKDFELDRAACQTQATREIAVNRSPGAELAVALLTGVYSVQDANAEARLRNYEACMIKKGYQRIELPMCKDAKAARAEGASPLNAQKRIIIDGQSCFTTDTAGRQIFHNQ